MKFRIFSTLVLFLTILGCIFFAKQFYKEHELNKAHTQTILSLSQEIEDLKRSVALYENKEVYLNSIIKSKENEMVYA